MQSHHRCLLPHAQLQPSQEFRYSCHHMLLFFCVLLYRHVCQLDELVCYQARELQEILGITQKFHGHPYGTFAFQLQTRLLGQLYSPELFLTPYFYHRDGLGLPRCSKCYQVHSPHNPACFSNGGSSKLHQFQDSSPTAHR